MYAVVVFIETDDVEVVPNNWLMVNEDLIRCAWPSYRSQDRITKCIREMELPSDNWLRYDVRILQKYDRYDKARSNADLARYTSDLNSETENVQEQPKKRRRIVRQISPDPSEVEDLHDETFSIPLPPKPLVCQTNKPLKSYSTNVKAPTTSEHKLKSKTISTGSCSIPLMTLQQLEKLETDCQDRDMRGKLTRYLGQCGGSTVAETTRNVLKKLMANAVALQCNWKGKRGKYGLHSTVMKQIICDAVRRNPVTCRAVDADVVETIKDWLRFAKDREGGRQRRAAKART